MNNSYLRYVTDASQIQLMLYYLVVAVSFIYLLYKYRKNSFQQYIILLFFGGLMKFISKFVFNIYHIIRTFFTLYWLNRSRGLTFNKNTFLVIIAFIFFSIIFFVSAYINGDYFNIIFSQYSKYFIVFALFIILKKYSHDRQLYFMLSSVIYDILIVQVFLSLFKFIIFGVTESIVGSISELGGAVATPLPILSFIVLWIIKNGKLNSKDWMLIFGFIFIGFVSDKRAIWFVLPIIMYLFFTYIPKKVPSLKAILVVLVLLPSIFYFGVRLSRTLNPEDVVWGSFDINYVYNYASNYMFGSEDRIFSTGLYYGRGGATQFLYNKLFNGDFTLNDFFGEGLRFIYTTSYEEFFELGYGIHSLGSANGAFQSYIANGFAGVISFIIFSFFIINNTKSNRLRNVLLLFFFWEYFFYTGILFRYPSLATLLIFIIIFSPFDISNRPILE